MENVEKALTQISGLQKIEKWLLDLLMTAFQQRYAKFNRLTKKYAWSSINDVTTFDNIKWLDPNDNKVSVYNPKLQKWTYLL